MLLSLFFSLRFLSSWAFSEFSVCYLRGKQANLQVGKVSDGAEIYGMMKGNQPCGVHSGCSIAQNKTLQAGEGLMQGFQCLAF